MSAKNHQLCHRPVRAGIFIYNPNAGASGTVGMVAQDEVGGIWIVSCYHVLVRWNMSAFPGSEVIYQPTSTLPAIAKTNLTKASSALDCAAAKIEPGVQVADEVLGVGRAFGIGPPIEGRRVVKSGAATGISEGVVRSVDGDYVEIVPIANYPTNYVLSDPGDSGAPWLDAMTNDIVALNLGLRGPGDRTVKARSMEAVLTALSLRSIGSLGPLGNVVV